ncbi:MAG: tRNA glutamyl-Q(34) synthetase GluQRS [Mariprofundus sp.]|nr:tRNA glutamyl-Q(34) synthetase GluQRS [Mariprofundus sp.]
MQYRTRFAPSPTGLLHVGNAYSALLCQAWAKTHNAELLLRIEDIDHTRCRSEFADAIIEDLSWLGLRWQSPVRIQSMHLQDYRQAIHQLRDMGVIYPCFCTRKQIQQEIMRMSSAPHAEAVMASYPGTCRKLPANEQHDRMQHEPFAWRLNIDKAMAHIGEDISWRDGSGCVYAVSVEHDVVIGRKDIDFSYHLAVVVDDALQGISHVIRGQDLKESTGIHRLLQKLLGLPEPVYVHHPLLCDQDGERLAKRNGATTLKGLRQTGVDVMKLRDFLTAAESLCWPFGKGNERELLNILGKAR